MDDSLEGLTFANFNDIPNFNEKLSKFFNEMQNIAGPQGIRLIPRPISGYACQDGERVVAISYYIIPKRFSLNYLMKYFSRPAKVEMGTVIIQEYRSRGVHRELIRLVKEMIRFRGYTNI